MQRSVFNFFFEIFNTKINSKSIIAIKLIKHYFFVKLDEENLLVESYGIYIGNELQKQLTTPQLQNRFVPRLSLTGSPTEKKNTPLKYCFDKCYFLQYLS